MATSLETTSRGKVISAHSCWKGRNKMAHNVNLRLLWLLTIQNVFTPLAFLHQGLQLSGVSILESRTNWYTRVAQINNGVSEQYTCLCFTNRISVIFSNVFVVYHCSRQMVINLKCGSVVKLSSSVRQYPGSVKPIKYVSTYWSTRISDTNIYSLHLGQIIHRHVSYSNTRAVNQSLR